MSFLISTENANRMKDGLRAFLDFFSNWNRRLKYKLINRWKTILDFFWVFQAYFRGKILRQKAYRFRGYYRYATLPSIKTTAKRINKLARWNGYLILSVGELQGMIKDRPPAGDYSAYIARGWWGDWPRVGHHVEGDGTHGEAYIADPPHFIVIRR